MDRNLNRLSPRERECLYWASEGKSSSDIAAILGLSPRTVDSYLEKTCAKFGVRTRIEAVASAVRAGILHPRPPADFGDPAP
ncbi:MULTISPECIES: helix-turn-helix domain-containing protein [Brevundimonas]|uniref:helix-turn-helix domain-containing protein n=1 Tax=Brevundimonas TaxID=41275 RepID=UPI0011D24F11|nr:MULTISPECIES: helix-turn-helix transcriptional regulator [Brevundimonas]